jgi:hypothetical protein
MPQGAAGVVGTIGLAGTTSQKRGHDQWVAALSADAASLDREIVSWPQWQATQTGTSDQIPWDQTIDPGLFTLLTNMKQALADVQGVAFMSPPFPDDGTTNENPHRMILRYILQFLKEMQSRLTNPPPINSAEPPPAPYNDNGGPKYKSWADYALDRLAAAAIRVGKYQGQNTIGFDPQFPSANPYSDDNVLGTLVAVADQMCIWA